METVSLSFRLHPDYRPTGKLTIIGQARCSAERMNAYLRRRNPQAPELAELYLRLGNKYGIRGDVAFCQMIYETRAWTRAHTGPSWAPLLLPQWADEQEVERLMRLLRVFASDEPLPAAETDAHVELIRRAGWRGAAPCWEDLSGKWTERSDLYGQDIAAIWRNMKEWSGEGEALMEERELGLRLRGAAAVRRTADWSEDMTWLKERELLPSPVPHPDAKVTWAELATLLRRMRENGQQ